MKGFKKGDLIWQPDDEMFNVVMETDGDVVVPEFVYKKEGERLPAESVYKNLSAVFRDNKEYFDAITEILRDSKTSPEEYYEFLRLAGEVIAGEESIFFKTIKKAYAEETYNYNVAIKRIEEKYGKRTGVDFENEKREIADFIKDIVSSVNVDKIREIIEYYKEDSKRIIYVLKNLDNLFSFKDKEMESDMGIDSLRKKIKIVFHDIFFDILFNNFKKENFEFLYHLSSHVDFFDVDYKNLAEKTDLQTFVRFLGNLRRNKKIIYEDEGLASDRNDYSGLVERISSVFMPQFAYHVIKNLSDREFADMVELIIRDIERGTLSFPEKYEKAKTLFSVSKLNKNNYYFENSPVESLKMLYHSQTDDFTYGEKLFILNSILSIGLFADKIGPGERKEIVLRTINILNSKNPKEFENRTIKPEEFYAFTGMYNLYGANAAYYVKECTFEQSLKAHYISIKESAEIAEMLESLINNEGLKLITGFHSRFKRLKESSALEREEHAPKAKETISESLNYIKSLFETAEGKNVLDNLGVLARSWDVVQEAPKTDIFSEGRDLRYVLNRKGFIHLAETNVSLFNSLINGKFIEAKEERVFEFKKKILKNGMDAIINYLESDKYTPVDTKAFILKDKYDMYGNNAVSYLKDITDEKDFFLKKGIFYFLKRLALNAEELKWLFSLEDGKIFLTLLSAGSDLFFRKQNTGYDGKHEEKDFDVSAFIDREKLKKLTEETPLGKFEESLFNLSILFTETARGGPVLKPKYEILNSGNFFVDAIMARNYVFYTLCDINEGGYSCSLKNLEGKDSYEIFESFIREASDSFAKSLRKASKNPESLYHVKRILEDVKDIFWTKKYDNEGYRFSVPVYGEPEKYKLYQSKILVPLYSLIKNVFINGITVYGEKENQFLTESLFTNGKIINKWFIKSGMYEELFVKGGLLSVLFKTEGKEGLKKLFNSFSDAPSGTIDLIMNTGLKESLRNLPRTLAVPPSKIPSSSFEKNKKLIAKIASDERLFGIEKEDSSTGEELLNKIKVAEYYGIISIKNKMEREGIIFKKNKEKTNEISR